ncbi:MAG: hypothetical protein IKE60_28470 [Reyranella sp.]|jgi:hypothetical protein|uniref:hypothetical protein n=1 Tax=Reyranella sp. TaxID=1929291 RepID=UPI0025E95852|nr:hypothetical protein [Reyranella sp.]MBR2818635.1 hypothetical protein [Reyranella sp.]
MRAGVQQDITDDGKIISRVRDEVRVPLDDFHAYWYLGKRFQYCPFLQYVHAPFRSATLNFNSMGFRGPEFVPGRTAAVRLAFFGASAMLGVPNATDEQTIPALCRAELARRGLQVEALNFAVMCSMIRNQHDALLKALLEFDPDVLVVYTGYNDVLRAYHGNVWKGYEDVETILQQGFEWNAHRAAPSYHLRNAWAAVERKVEFTAQPRGSDAFERLLQKRREFTIRRSGLESAYGEGRRLFDVLVAQICALAERHGKPLVFCHQPALSATAKPKSPYERAYEQHMDLTFGPDPVSAEPQRRAFSENYAVQRVASHDLAARLGAHVYDPEPAIAALGAGTDIFYDYAHLTVTGNRLVATGLSSLLTEKELLPAVGSVATSG